MQAMKVIRLVASLMTISLFWAQKVNAAEPAAPEKTGLAVGQSAPSFTLKDQNGAEVSLASLLGKGPVALVFYRSADW